MFITMSLKKKTILISALCTYVLVILLFVVNSQMHTLRTYASLPMLLFRYDLEASMNLTVFRLHFYFLGIIIIRC